MDISFWLCLLIVIILTYRHITRNFNHWKNLSVPSLHPVPIFGNFFKVATLKQSLGQLAQDIYNYADSRYTGFFIFDQPFLLVRDPNVIKHILIKDFEHFHNRTGYSNVNIDKLSSKALFLIKNPEWKEVRTKLTPVFTSGKIKNMTDLVLKVSEDLKTYIGETVLKDGESIESKEMSMKYTTDTISSCAFGINSNSFKFKNAEFVNAARRLVSVTIIRVIPVASYYIAPWLVKLFKMKFLDDAPVNFIKSVFWEQMKQRTASCFRRGDLIDTLLQLQEAYGNTFDGEVLVAQALQFFIAGFETTGSTISFTLYELAANKIIQKRLRDEINKILKIHGTISYEAIMDMKYLDNVVSETLRKYPPLTFLDRRCSKAYTIPDSNVTIQEGIPIYISLLGLHMDPAHFPEPEKFDPDRFSEENRSSIKPFTYMPFGEGPRNCIGARFGLLSAKSAIIAVIANFEVELDSKTPYPITLDPKSGFLIAPKGGVLYLRYKKCTPEAI